MATDSATNRYRARKRVGGISAGSSFVVEGRTPSRPRRAPRIGAASAERASGTIIYLEPDPYGQLVDVSRYRYGYNSPLLYTDPDGRGLLRVLCLSAFTTAGAWAGSTVGVPVGAGIGGVATGGAGAVATGGPGVVLGVPGAGFGAVAGGGIGGLAGGGLGAAAGLALCPDDEPDCPKQRPKRPVPCRIDCEKGGTWILHEDFSVDSAATCYALAPILEAKWKIFGMIDSCVATPGLAN